jgi:hypothetical protein
MNLNKNLIAKLCATGLLLAIAAAATTCWAADAPGQKPYKGSAEFEKMKSLVGTWKGKMDMGQGPVEMTVTYTLTSGGSAIEERITPGTPHEMVTMYHDKNGKLSLTHYCVLANRPGMLLQSSDGKTLKFDFDPTCGVDAKTETHMHALTLTFEGPDTIQQDWQLYQDGALKDSHPIKLTRVRS